jgi:hypothetical protein
VDAGVDDARPGRRAVDVTAAPPRRETRVETAHRLRDQPLASRTFAQALRELAYRESPSSLATKPRRLLDRPAR